MQLLRGIHLTGVHLRQACILDRRTALTEHTSHRRASWRGVQLLQDILSDDNNTSNFSTGFPSTGFPMTEGYTEGASNATTGCYLVAEPFIELRLLNPSYLFGVGQQFDGIPLNYGDTVTI